MQKALKSKAGGLDRKWDILHCVFPREDSQRVPGKLDGPNKKFASVYLALQDRSELHVGGYDEQPYLCVRFDKWGSDNVWGYSPAYECLPVARQLNLVTMDIDLMADLLAHPRYLLPDNMKYQIDLTPGGATYYDHSKPDVKPEEWLSQANYQIAVDWVKGKKDDVNKTYYVYIFQMLQQLQDKKMTAYEVAQRLSENLTQFTPVFDRYVTEFLNPLLLRVFSICLRQGKLGDPPPALLVPLGMQQPGKGKKAAQGKAGMLPPKIVITSRISLALKALQNRGSQETLEMLVEIVKIYPPAIDNFDLDVFVRDYAKNSGLPPDTLRELQSMQKLRQKRVDLMKTDKALQQAAVAAKAGKDLEKRPESLKDAALDRLGVGE
jgi:hypothetical protein